MRDLFASRTLRVAALLWVVGFFVVFMPAHRRGLVTLPGACGGVADTGEARTQAAPCPLCMTGDDAGEPVPADAAVNCSICHLKAGLDVPPTVVLAPAFVDELDFLLARFDAAESPLLATQTTLHGRAPPPSA